jgi:NAD(P)-dependent dehydrogenase (short-subunit alcohol dehydrogenase family)
MGSKWTAADIPDQSGRVAVVTGANSGLGAAIARELARAGADVILACRDVAKGSQAASSIRDGVPGAKVDVSALDLADLESVRSFADGFTGGLDLLINNAGVMAPPRRLTKDGFESQFGTNHLGHFALTGRLMPALLQAPAPRVVTQSSGAHRIGSIHFDDLQGERRYNNWLWYGQSKLANLMFAFELDRLARAADTQLASVAAHPGYAATNLQFAGPSHAYEKWMMAVTNRLIAQSAEMGALPALFAATKPDVPGSAFVGPDAMFEQRGYPRIVTAAGKAYNQDAWKQLWEVSEQLTGVRYQFP